MPTKTVAKTFEAVLEHSGNSLNWIIIRVPLDVAQTWGKRGQLRVKGEINGFAFHSTLFPTGKGGHFLIVNKKMQVGGKTSAGLKAKFRMMPDTAPRKVELPAEWMRMLRKSKQLTRFYDSLNSSMRNWIARFVGEGKAAETRIRRADEMAERLLQVMDAERELPPVLQSALAYNPKARAGWDLMPPSHRRSHLFGIFYPRNPESRARRVAKAVEMMLEYAEKHEQKQRTRPSE